MLARYAWLRRCACLTAVCGLLLALCSSPVRADTVTSQDSVGVSSEYASNPFLVPDHAESAESVALIANLPITYTSDAQVIDLTPRFRVGQSYGPVAPLSNYEYLDGDWHWSSERNTFVATAEWHHDSTLYNQFENEELLGHDLGRSEQSASLAWQRALSERSDVQLSGSWDQVAYSNNSLESLTNYRYAQGALEYDRNLTERWRWSTAAGYGQYTLLDGSYRSDQRFAQTTLNAQWSERWATMAQIGYSYLSAHALAEVCCQLEISPGGELYAALIPLVQVASRGAPNFAIEVDHKYERTDLQFALSRAIQPSGLGELLTEDDVSLNASIPWTERVTLSGTLHWSRLRDTLERLDLQGRQFYEVDLNANWQWSEYWTVGLQGSYVQGEVALGIPQSRGETVYLTISRLFRRLRF